MKRHLVLCIVLIVALIANPAWAGCGTWVVRNGIEYFFDPAFDRAAASSTGSSATLNPDSTAKQSPEKIPDANPHPASKTADIEVGKPRVASDEKLRQPSTTAGGLISGQNMDVGGKWTVRLENEGATINPLTLIQTGENVMGMGTLNEQNTKLQVSAKGTVSSNAMHLDIWTIVSEYGNKIDKHIELELLNLDRGISGSYEISSDEELTGKGNATASRSGA